MPDLNDEWKKGVRVSFPNFASRLMSRLTAARVEIGLISGMAALLGATSFCCSLVAVWTGVGIGENWSPMRFWILNCGTAAQILAVWLVILSGDLDGDSRSSLGTGYCVCCSDGFGGCGFCMPQGSQSAPVSRGTLSVGALITLLILSKFPIGAAISIPWVSAGVGWLFSAWDFAWAVSSIGSLAWIAIWGFALEVRQAMYVDPKEHHEWESKDLERVAKVPEKKHSGGKRL